MIMRRRSFLIGAAAALGSAYPAWGAADTLGTLCFVRRDGLWIRRLPDGEPKLLAHGSRVESPRFSASGKWIAYSRAGRPHVVSSERGEARPLSAAEAATQWLPDRDELLVESGSGLNLFAAVNGWSSPVMKLEGACLPVLISPNGNDIVYSDAVAKGRGPGGEPMRTGRLCRRAFGQSGEIRVLTSKYLVAQMPFGWSRSTGDILFWEDPDFSGSAIADGLDLFRIPSAGGSPSSLGVSTLVHNDMLAFSPEQSKLAVIAGDGRESWDNKRVTVIDLKSGGKTYLSGESAVAVNPCWSPAGDRIAFSAAPSPGPGPIAGGGDEARRLLARRRIWVTDADGSAEPRQLTDGARYRDEEPIWSQDGEHILFARLDSVNNKTLWLMKADGSDLAQVAGPLAGSGADAWFGYYGYIDWRNTMDWFRG